MVVLFYGYLIPHYGYEISQICHNHYYCHHFAQEKSLIPGFVIDLSDNQWREFRNSLPLAISAAIFITLGHEIFRYFKISTPFFHFVVGICFLIVQHGWHSIIVLAIILITFIGCKFFRQCGSIWTWCCAIFLILLKESYRIQDRPGYQVHKLQILNNTIIVFTYTV